MDMKDVSRLMVVSRDKDNTILDCFLGPLAQGKLQEALALAHILLTHGRPHLVRVEIHPSEHSLTGYVEKPLAALTKEDVGM